MNDRIKIIEKYVDSLPTDLKPAHGLDHVMRVRTWALKIARAENFQDLEMIEAAALLHDIGRTIPPETGKTHGELSARMAKDFLTEHKLFNRGEIEKICEAVAHHSDIKKIESKLLDILRDADILDLLGAIGVMRGVAGDYDKTIFDPACVKGETWGMSNEDFNRRFQNKIGAWSTLSDQLNFQASCLGNIKTNCARHLAEPMVEYMKNFILEVEREAKLNLE